MTTITGKNRFFLSTFAFAALGFFFAADGNAQKPARPRPTPTPTATPAPTATPKPLCPLPDNYGVKKAAITPEKPLQAVCHNGKILCLPQSAANAHIQHGDTPLGPCNKPGNQGPCP